MLHIFQTVVCMEQKHLQLTKVNGRDVIKTFFVKTKASRLPFFIKTKTETKSF